MNRTYRFHPGAYELGENEKFYSDMEAKGWRLVKRGGYLSRFARVEPSRARYRVEVYTPPFLEQSVLPEEQIAVFEECGWEYVADHGNLHIFRSPEGSDAPEFYDDPAQQAATLRKARRDLWWSLAFSAVWVVLGWLYCAVLSGLTASRWSAQFVKSFVQIPGLLLFYFFWVAYLLCESLRSGWKISRTYARLKKGLPMDHAPKLGRRVVSRALLVLTVLSLLVTAGQLFARRKYDVPARSDGPYILLSDAGWEGQPGKLFYGEPGVETFWSPLADVWETCEIINTPGDGQVWMYQDVYRLRLPAMADRLAWALMEDSTFARSAENFRELDVPGLDRVFWVPGGMELVAVKGELVNYVTFLGREYEDFDPLPLCEALAARWAQPGGENGD